MEGMVSVNLRGFGVDCIECIAAAHSGIALADGAVACDPQCARVEVTGEYRALLLTGRLAHRAGSGAGGDGVV